MHSATRADSNRWLVFILHYYCVLSLSQALGLVSPGAHAHAPTAVFCVYTKLINLKGDSKFTNHSLAVLLTHSQPASFVLHFQSLSFSFNPVCLS